MRFWKVGTHVEGSDIGRDEIEGGLGFLWDVDAEIECGL